MAITFLLPKRPIKRFPLCPCTVDTGKFGIAAYGIVCLISMALPSSPSPVPNMIPIEYSSLSKKREM